MSVAVTMRPRPAISRRATTLGLLLAGTTFVVGCAGQPRTGRDGVITVRPATGSQGIERTDEGGTPVEASGATLDALDPASLLSLDEARADVATLLRETTVRRGHQWTEERVALAQKLGYDEQRALRLLATFVERGDRAGEVRLGIDEKTPVDVVGVLFGYLEHIGTAHSVAPVFALAKRSGSGHTGVVDELLQRAALAKLDAKCAPPSAQDVTKQRAELAGFTVIERVGAGLVAREPTAGELDDFAYLQAALARDGGPVGQDEITGKRLGLAAPPANARLDADREALVAAMTNGGPKLVQRSARSYLTLLGYPGPIRAEEESNMTWGGPGYANVMRDLARVDEVLGDVAEAAELYRRAPPGGGACGTSVSYRLEGQRKGLIRAAERLGQCHTVVRDRLYAVHDEGFDYGPSRLAAAGWDVGRLYRAALLTVERQAPANEITRALDQLPSPRRDEALARFERLGAEPWAHELRATFGLADVGGVAALPQLLRLAQTGGEGVRVEALHALAELAERPPADPCVPTDSLWLGGISETSGEKPRVVKHLNHVCATKLPAAAESAVVDAFVAAAKDPSDRLREIAAQGLARVAPPARAIPVLMALAKDGYARPGWSHVGKNKLRTPVLPVAEAAQTALVQVREAEKREREERRKQTMSSPRAAAK